MSQVQRQPTARGDGMSSKFFAGMESAEVLCREVIEASPDCFKILDLEGRLEFMNRNGQCLMDIADFAQVAAKPWPDLWPEAEQDKVRDSLAAARSGDTARFTAFCPTAAGTPRWWDVVVYSVTDGSGNPAKLVSISRDITPAVRAQADLEGMLAELRHLLSTGAGQAHAA